MSINMSEEEYNAIRENVANYIEEYSKRFGVYRKERMIDIITNDICDDTRNTIHFCTATQTEAFKKLMGVDDGGQRQTYANVKRALRKCNVRELVYNATRNVKRGMNELALWSEGIRDNVGYDKEQGTIFPEDISVENLFNTGYYARDKYNIQKLLDRKIYNVNDLISLSTDDAIDLIMTSVDPNKTRSVSSAAYNIIKLIHLLGYVFADENGYVEQQEKFHKLKQMLSGNEKIDNANLTNYLNKRNELLDIKDKLLSEEEVLSQQLQELKQQLEETKQQLEINRKSIIENKSKILNVESTIRVRKL